MTIHYCSDTHFGHVNIRTYQPLRPGNDVPEMNEALIANWNAVVDINDHVYIIGDFAMGKIADSLPCVSRLNGTKTIIAGNHDRFHPSMARTDEKRDRWMKEYLDAGFEFLYEEEAWNVLPSGRSVQLCHFPFATIEDHVAGREDQYNKFRPADEGQLLLHGHVHGAYGAITGPRSIDVGVDVPDWGFAPVSETTIDRYFDGMVG